MSDDDHRVTRSEAVEASRRWARRVWLAQLVVVGVGFVLLVTTDVGLPVVAVTIVALLGAHVWARRSLGRDLAELGRPDASDRPDRDPPGPAAGT